MHPSGRARPRLCGAHGADGRGHGWARCRGGPQGPYRHRRGGGRFLGGLTSTRPSPYIGVGRRAAAFSAENRRRKRRRLHTEMNSIWSASSELSSEIAPKIKINSFSHCDTLPFRRQKCPLLQDLPWVHVLGCWLHGVAVGAGGVFLCAIGAQGARRQRQRRGPRASHTRRAALGARSPSQPPPSPTPHPPPQTHT